MQQQVPVQHVRMQLENGHVIQADIGTWFMAFFANLSNAQQAAVCQTCEEMQVTAMAQHLAKSPPLVVG